MKPRAQGSIWKVEDERWRVKAAGTSFLSSYREVKARCRLDLKFRFYKKSWKDARSGR